MNTAKQTDIRCSACKQVLVVSSRDLDWDDWYGEPHTWASLSCGCDTWNVRVPTKLSPLPALAHYYVTGETL